MTKTCQCGTLLLTRRGYDWCSHCDEISEHGRACQPCAKLKRSHGVGPRTAA